MEDKRTGNEKEKDDEQKLQKPKTDEKTDDMGFPKDDESKFG